MNRVCLVKIIGLLIHVFSSILIYKDKLRRYLNHRHHHGPYHCRRYRHHCHHRHHLPHRQLRCQMKNPISCCVSTAQYVIIVYRRQYCTVFS